MKSDGNQLFQDLRTLANNVAVGWTVTRKDGVILGFTSSDIEFDYLGVTYKPSNAFAMGASVQQNTFAVGNTSAQGILNMDIPEEDILAGLYEDAIIRVFWIDPTDVSKGHLALQGGRIGEVKVGNNSFEAELRSVAQKLQQPFGDVYTLDCRANLGDSKCKFRLAAPTWTPSTLCNQLQTGDASIGTIVKPTEPNGFWYRCKTAGTTGEAEPTWTEEDVADGTVVWQSYPAPVGGGTVSSAFNRAVFSAAGMTEPAFFFNHGELTWLTGLNAGKKMEVRSFQGEPRTFHLLEEMWAPIEPGDTFEVKRGCTKTRLACKQFDNVFNMRAFPFMPTEEKALETPNYSSQGEQKEQESGGIS